MPSATTHKQAAAPPETFYRLRAGRQHIENYWTAATALEDAKRIANADQKTIKVFKVLLTGPRGKRKEKESAFATIKPIKRNTTPRPGRPGQPKKKAATKRPVRRNTKPATKRTAKRARKRNPTPAEIDQAAQLSERFHGRPAKEARQYEEPGDSRQTLTNLGSLVELIVKSPAGRVSITFQPATRLAASPDGGQLYIIGGDQSIDLEELGLEEQETKDHVEIGPVTHVIYGSRKAQDQFANTNWKHRFGEEEGTQPTLCADRLNERLYFVGGSYTVEPEGIVN